MTLGRQVDDTVHLLLPHQLQHPLEVADIHLHELVIGPVLDILQVGQIAGIGQFIQVDNLVLRIFVHKKPDYMAADKPGTSGDDD